MKARGRRPNAFIVFECLETPMKHEARVFEMASQSKLKLIQTTVTVMISFVIIYIQKLLDADWLIKGVQLSCNTGAKYVTRVQVTNGL